MVILVADDDADDLEFFELAVSQIAPDVCCKFAYNGIEAIHALEIMPQLPGYIFLDLNMPKMDGRQCLGYLKKNPIFKGIPVIIYSTSRRQADVDDVINEGAAAFITKPHTFQLLKEQIASTLEKISPATHPS